MGPFCSFIYTGRPSRRDRALPSAPLRTRAPSMGRCPHSQGACEFVRLQSSEQACWPRTQTGRQGVCASLGPPGLTQPLTLSTTSQNCLPLHPPDLRTEPRWLLPHWNPVALRGRDRPPSAGPSHAELSTVCGFLPELGRSAPGRRVRDTGRQPGLLREVGAALTCTPLGPASPSSVGVRSWLSAAHPGLVLGCRGASGER